MRRDSVVKKMTATITAMGLMLGFILWLGAPATAEAQEAASAAAMAQANNPLAGAYALNLQNYYAGSLYGVPDRSSNTFWARAAVPIGRTLTRASLPLATRPSSPTEAQAGLGDFNIFTAYLLVSDPTTSLGIGPLVPVLELEEHRTAVGLQGAGQNVVAGDDGRVLYLVVVGEDRLHLRHGRVGALQ